MGKYIDLSDIKDTLGSQAINAGQSFLAGKVTNAFSLLMEDEGMKAMTNAAASGIGLYSTVSQVFENDNYESIIESLSADLLNKATESITKGVSEVAVDFVNKHVDAITRVPKDIVSNSLAYFNSYKLSITDIIKEYIVPKEYQTKIEIEAAETNKKATFINKMKDKYMENRSYIVEGINTGLSYVNLVMSYIGQGPEWVESKMDKGIGWCVEQAQNKANEQWKIDKENIDKFVKNTSDEIGSRMTEEYNNILRKQAQKIIAEKEKEIQKLVTKAITLLQKSKLQIMAKIGINLPI